jgi:hypothetical protein
VQTIRNRDNHTRKENAVGRRLIVIAATVATLIGVGAVGAFAQSAAPRFVLTGVVFVEGGTGGRAWLQEPTLTQNQVVTVRQGDSIGDYRLASIFEDRVVLDGPGGKVTVPLAGVSGPAAAGAAKPAPSAKLGEGVPQHKPPAPMPPGHVDTRTDRTKKFKFNDLPSLLGGGRN